MQKMGLKEVFTPGGQPSVTYVGREHLNLEGELRKYIAKGFALIVVTGPTKSGKTVLCRRVLSGLGNFVSAEGGQIRKEEDFWSHIAYQLNIAQTATRGSSTSEVTQDSAKLGGGISGLISGDYSKSNSSTGQSSVSLSYNSVPLMAVLSSLIDRNVTLLVDDFHYIPQDAQKGIIQALKASIFKGLSVIFLAVPHRAFDPITVEDEMQGRFSHMPIPAWTQGDLILIPQRGFEALNIQCSQEVMSKICLESFSNPLLVQEICSEICADIGVFERSPVPKNINLETVERVLPIVAKSKGFPKYRKLKEGPQSRKDRLSRNLRAGGTADIYEALMLALARLGPRPRTQYDELRSSLRDLLDDGQLPQKHEITAALSHMSKIAKEKMEGEPPLEFIRDEDSLVITDPFLLFYMRWQKDKEAPGSVLSA